jgi:hypothetical protein
MTKRIAAISYATVFLLFWALSAGLWCVCGIPLGALAAPIVPILGCYFGLPGDNGVRLICIGVVAITAGLVTTSLLWKPHPALVVMTHVALVIYWFCSLCLLGVGV